MNNILPQKQFELIAILASGREMAGREVARFYKEETGHGISYGTLYSTFRRLKDSGCVTVRDDEDEDGRVRFFRITGEGSAALAASRQHYATLASFGSGFQGAPA